MLTNTLLAVALQEGFTYRSIARAVGIPDRGHVERWMPHAGAAIADNASVRLANMVLNDPMSAETWLLHAEAAIHATDMPQAIGAVVAGAVLEREMLLACRALALDVPADPKLGSIAKYGHLLRAAGALNLTDLKHTEVVGEARNNAAHGAFELVDPGTAVDNIEIVRRLVLKLTEYQAAEPSN